ncbi:SIMPL domain-containing protein, partial [Candidatus Microgenomates bacterium]|nr:SIMPL domain-containing protein [Candidatus Microgenomates bacterium]
MQGNVRPLVTIAFIFLLTFLYARFGTGIPVNVISTQKTDLFTVNGTGEVTVIPDTAKVTIGITIDRPSLKSAQEEANRIINAITDQLVKIAIDKKDIKTTNYSINPSYD